ncbi:MAG: hypothetical protein WA364_00480 [Candidatus Nitrosopolaris sp.]
MGFPSWREFIEKERMFYKEVDYQLGKKVEGLSDKHQIVTIAFKTSLHVLPQPFDVTADSIYESVEGYDKEKFSEVKEFLHTVKKRGEYHYNELAPNLSKITDELIDLKDDIARQNTLLYVRDIMMSSDTIDGKLHKIRRIQEQLSELKSSQW